RNQVIAVELAQEGIELVRNVRDSNWMSGAADSFANFPSGSESDCRIDYKYTSGSSLPCDGDFNLTKSNGFYISTVSSSAVFKRKITISYDTGSSSTANSMTVTSIVTWGGLNFPSTTNCTTATKCAYAQTTLTRWGGK
ncbi:MAG: hypothetical protein P4L58_02150, partial [Candidatus Pacebacteria bacterium]|nr:hypothetical protein [Candidatus Paceibacterota bacterium]